MARVPLFFSHLVSAVRWVKHTIGRSMHFALMQVFQQNFSAITCTDDELKRLRDAADALHSTAAASFTRVRAS